MLTSRLPSNIGYMDYIGEEKVCRKCTESKNVAEFRRDNKSLDKLRSWCHRCELNSQYAYQKTEAGRAKIKRNSYSILRFSHSKNKAKRKGIEWALTKAEFNNLKLKPCTYCNQPIVTTGSGLDRKDPKIGYVTTNVVPCCYLCNTMKWNYWTYEEMLEIGKVAQALIAKRANVQLPNIGNL